MKNFSIISKLAFSALCAPLLFSCSSDDGKEEKEEDISTLPKYNFCVFDEEEMCLPGPAQICPKGGELLNFCPPGYFDMKLMAGSSSSGLNPSSSGVEVSSSSGEPQVPGTFGANNKFLDPRDGKEYSYVISGSRVWMLQNLNYSKDNTIGGCYGVDVNSENPSRDSINSCGNGYGRIYDYPVAMGVNSPQGLCPDGWHIPSLAEWESVATGLPTEFYLRSGNYSSVNGWQHRNAAGYYWMSGETSRDYIYVECGGGGSNCFLSGRTATNLTMYNSVRCVANSAIDCGYQKYNPALSFCSQNKVYERCGGLIYSPETDFCSGSVIYAKCDTAIYDPATQGCLGSLVFPKCGSNLYNPETHFCSGSTIYAKCGSEDYTPGSQGCFEGIVFPSCNGKLYNISNHFCYSDEVYDKCGTASYNPETQFCGKVGIIDTVLAKCGTAIYDPATQGCNGTTVLSKCGAELLYSSATHFCSSNAVRDTVIAKCGTTAYNPETDFCSGTTILPRCGGLTYIPASQGCAEGVVQPKCGTSLYNSETHFCSGTGTAATIYAKCGGVTYNPTFEECVGGEVISSAILSEDFEGTNSFTVVNGRNVTVAMRDSYGDGWNGSAALRITVNGNNLTTTKLSSGSSNTYTFSVNGDDVVSFYWVKGGSYDGECAFAVYYTDITLSPAFNPASGATNDASILVSRLYSSLGSTTDGALLGSFTAVNNNRWYVGTDAKYDGANAAYIATSSGTTNSYTLTAASTVHIYRNVTFPASTEPYTLSFNWKGAGEASYDILTVHLVETTVTPVAGTVVSSGTLLGTYYGYSTWQQANVTIPATNSGTTKRLVFTWRNNASGGTNPPIAVDNIKITM